MKRQIVHSRSSIFLMEIIIAILFFSLVSAVCLQVFVKAHNMTGETARLNMAVTVAENTAEMAKAADGPEKTVDMVRKIYPDAKAITADPGEDKISGTNGLTAGFNGDWKSCSAGSTDCCYIMQALYDDTSNTVSWHIEIRAISAVGDKASSAENTGIADTDDVIYELDTEVYYGQ